MLAQVAAGIRDEWSAEPGETNPAPTFVTGVDLFAEESYIVAAYRHRQVKVSSIAKDYCLKDDSVKIRLCKEIIHYWRLN